MPWEKALHGRMPHHGWHEIRYLAVEVVEAIRRGEMQPTPAYKKRQYSDLTPQYYDRQRDERALNRRAGTGSSSWTGKILDWGKYWTGKLRHAYSTMQVRDERRTRTGSSSWTDQILDWDEHWTRKFKDHVTQLRLDSTMQVRRSSRRFRC